jgi:hypothetical protein
VARLVILPSLRDNIEYRDWTGYKPEWAYNASDIFVEMECDDFRV